MSTPSKPDPDDLLRPHVRLTVQQWLNSGDRPIGMKPFFLPDEDITIGLVRFDNKKQMFLIYTQQGMPTYDMEGDRILSSAALLDFLFQIHSKEWITGQHLKDLLDCITIWIHRDYHRFPQDFFDVIGGMNQGLDKA